MKGLPAEWGTCFRTIIPSSGPVDLTCWKDTIAVGLESGEIMILSGTTGSQTAILSGHTDYVRALAFSLDGASLVSGSDDTTIKLWDVQTGGVVKAFHGHTDWVYSVSISTDCTIIASGSRDKSICLWTVQTGECYYIMKQQAKVRSVTFSPIHSQHLISVSGKRAQWWGIDGHQINSSYDGSYVGLSSDGTQLVLCQKADIVVQSSDSGEIKAKFHMPNSTASGCCFSPDGRLVAVAAEDNSVYIWDTTSSNPHLVETLVGHTHYVVSPVFSSSSLITSSWDGSVKFWQVSTPSTDPVMDHPKPIPPISAQIKSITLHVNDGVYITSDLNGVVSMWDILTGSCKASLQTPAKGACKIDTQPVDDRLILVWHADQKISVWDIEKEKLLNEIAAPWSDIDDIRISGDGSKVFCLQNGSIGAWSTWTGESVGQIKADTDYDHTSLVVNGSRVWAYSPNAPPYKEGPWGWDFGIPDSSPVPLPITPSLHLSDTKLWDFDLSGIKDVITGKVVLQLGGRFARPFDVQLDGRYFVAHYWSGEVLILDFNDVLLW